MNPMVFSYYVRPTAWVTRTDERSEYGMHAVLGKPHEHIILRRYSISQSTCLVLQKTQTLLIRNQNEKD